MTFRYYLDDVKTTSGTQVKYSYFKQSSSYAKKPGETHQYRQQWMSTYAIGSDFLISLDVATKLTGFHGSKPESVTDVFVYLASDESQGVTGKMLTSFGWKSQLR